MKVAMVYPDGTYGASERFTIDHSANVVSTEGSDLNISMAIGTDSANVYVGNRFDEISNTYVKVYYVADGIRYKHFAYVLEKDKTHIPLTDLLPRTYLVDVTQVSTHGKKATGAIAFEIRKRPEPASAERVELLLSKVDELLKKLG